MAVTSKKSKARLDYGEALNDALFYKKEGYGRLTIPFFLVNLI